MTVAEPTVEGRGGESPAPARRPPHPRLRDRVLGSLRPEQRQALRSPLLLTGAVIAGAFVLVAVLAPVLSPYDPRTISGPSFAHPSSAHLLGTDQAGNDILSELIWGARQSLEVALASATLATMLGVLVGVGSAIVGGWVEAVGMRLVDVFLAVPGLPFAVLLIALAGPSQVTLILVIALGGWAQMARIARSQTLTVRERGYVKAARGFGGGSFYLLRRHLVPAVSLIVIAFWIEWLGVSIFLESGLAFLGLGDPSHVSWGTMLDAAFRHQGLFFTNLWLWWVVPAGLAITLAVVGFTLLGVGVEPVVNPRLSRNR